MTSILTNTSATIALQTLRSINQQLDTTSNRVSTGQRITSAADGAAYWAIASTLKSDNGSLGSLKDAMSLDKNSIDAASAGLNKVIDQLTTIKNALTSATSEQADKSKLQNDITVALSAIKNYSDNTVMNGSNWLSVKSDTSGFAAVKNLVAAYSRVGNTVSVSKTTLDTSSFILYDNATTPAGSATIGSTMTGIASAASTSGVTVTASTGTAVQGFMDTAYTLSGTGISGYSSTTVAGNTIANQKTGTTTSGTSILGGTSSDDSIGLSDGQTLTVNNVTFTFKTTATAANDIALTSSLSYLASRISSAAGAAGATATVSGATLSFSTGTTSDLTISGNSTALSKLGLTGAMTARTPTTVNTTSIKSIDITNASQAAISSYLKIVDATTQQLLTGASKLGSMSTLLKAQSEFTQQLMDINTSSIGSLVDANIEEESTKLKALQTQQQLGIQSLSIANSSSQNVLSLFR